ncbi:phage tail tape measure protein [Pseudomonas mosselii]|uniref:Phage tail tape measure protein n=1 Tax=Pseudomonas mosselii TaxID=78327 RepID=A0A7W2JV79_9PSED|nr:phage tail tape measure protein [Pseudomonas mosselii]MBA6065710.1 phage tail tape measure protein [Pseudomonas mosselii]
MADKFQLKALITGVDKLSPVLTGVRKNVATLRKQINASGLGKITFADAVQGGAMAAPFVMGVKAAINFESAMADVKKVVDFETPEQFQAMSTDVLDLSERLPMAADGIAAIVAAGGQSGIARAELNQFAEDAVKMGVAFDQTAEQSGEMMAKWRTAFHLNQAEVVTLADKINYLGNTGAASTAQISAIVTAIGPLGEVAGVNAGQLAAMGSALAGVGIAQDVAATGIKNFMLTLTAGNAATKSQREAYKALRLDANQIAEGMQKDSEGTINKVLKTLAKVEKSKQAAVLTNLFGKESVGAIAPLLTSLDTLQKNFKNVGAEGKFAGSMEAEYSARAATTANALQLLQNRVTRLGISVGSILLPPLNDFLAFVGPLVSQVAGLAAAHPGLIKGILGAAVGFTVLRLAAASATAVLTVMNGVASMSPIGMIVRGIALAAGFLIANWDTVGPFFEALWELIKAYTVPAWELFKQFAAWTPLGFIIKNWEPIVGFFKGIWDRVRKFIEPMMKFMGMDDVGEGEGITATMQRAAYAQNVRNGEAVGQGDGALLAANAGQQAAAQQQAMSARLGIPATADLLKAPAVGTASLLRAPGGPAPGSLVQQAAQGQKQGLEGSIAVRFENAPPGMRVEEAKTNQPGVSVSQNVGYRSLAR